MSHGQEEVWRFQGQEGRRGRRAQGDTPVGPIQACPAGRTANNPVVIPKDPKHDRRRQDYQVSSKDEAIKLAKRLAGIEEAHPAEPPVEEMRDPDTGEVIGLKQGKNEVHYHPDDLAGHTGEKFQHDGPAQSPHVNYENWNNGKANGSYGHVVFNPE